MTGNVCDNFFVNQGKFESKLNISDVFLHQSFICFGLFFADNHIFFWRDEWLILHSKIYSTSVLFHNVHNFVSSYAKWMNKYQFHKCKQVRSESANESSIHILVLIMMLVLIIHRLREIWCWWCYCGCFPRLAAA